LGHVIFKELEMKRVALIILSMLLITACTKPTNKLVSISPIKAIELSNELAPHGVEGVFEMTVKGYEAKHRMAFLNSEADIKDQRNLIIALRPNAVKEITDKYGMSPQDFFNGKTIRVKGEAKRVKMWTRFKHRNLRNYHYQTQVFVHSAEQIQVM
jgi:hypothetical protein